MWHCLHPYMWLHGFLKKEKDYSLNIQLPRTMYYEYVQILERDSFWKDTISKFHKPLATAIAGWSWAQAKSIQT